MSRKAPINRRARLGQIESIRAIGKRRDDIHRVAEHERRTLVAVERAIREGPRDFQPRYVAVVDLVELAEATVGIIAGLTGPVALPAAGSGVERPPVRPDDEPNFRALGRLCISRAARDEKCCQRRCNNEPGISYAGHHGTSPPIVGSTILN